MTDKEKYISPFSTRYASPEMQEVFSESFKFKTWRRLWISLAKAEKELGWKAEFGIEEMCRDSWNWQKKNPNGYED